MTHARPARSHLWDWPKHRVADVESEANAIQTRLKSGQAMIHQIYADAGLDFEDELAKAAVALRITEDELCERLLDVILPPVQVGGSGKSPPAATPVVPDSAKVAAALIQDILTARGANGHGQAV